MKALRPHGTSVATWAVYTNRSLEAFVAFGSHWALRPFWTLIALLARHTWVSTVSCWPHRSFSASRTLGPYETPWSLWPGRASLPLGSNHPLRPMRPGLALVSLRASEAFGANRALNALRTLEVLFQ